jgi:hypothetical protein
MGLRTFKTEDLNNLADDIEFLRSKDIIFDAAPFVGEAQAAYHRSKNVRP